MPDSQTETQTELLRGILAELRALREVVAPEPRQLKAEDCMIPIDPGAV